MANEKNLKKFTSEYQPAKRGRPKGRLNRKTLFKKWLEISEKTENPLTGEFENLSQADIVVLAIIKEARNGSIAHAKELFDSAFGKVPFATEDPSDAPQKIQVEIIEKTIDDKIQDDKSI